MTDPGLHAEELFGFWSLGKRQQVLIYGCASGESQRRNLPHEHSPEKKG
jgi:hypothetical protein